jgi:hypothetical protein
MKNYLDVYATRVKTQKHLGTELTKLTLPGSVSFVSANSKDIAEKEVGNVSFVSSVSKDIPEKTVSKRSEISTNIALHGAGKTAINLAKISSDKNKLFAVSPKPETKLHAFQTPWTGTCFACDKPVTNYYENCPHCGDFTAWF